MKAIIPIVSQLASVFAAKRSAARHIKLKTDKDGVYEIYDLPPGKYTITPPKIDGFYFYSAGRAGYAEFTLDEKGLAEWNFIYTIDLGTGDLRGGKRQYSWRR